jgi:hypothetical protein
MAQERVKKLQQQNKEYLARCKDFTAANEASRAGQSLQPMTIVGDKNLAHLEVKLAKAEYAWSNFEANKVGFVKKAVCNIVTNVYALIRENPIITAAPSQKFINFCCVDVMEILGMQ